MFDDPLYLIFPDPDHSIGEERFIIMGKSTQNQLLVVSYTKRGQITRLISARTATRQERKVYESEV